MNAELWTVEFSLEQGAFHITTLEETLRNNRELIRRRLTSLYMLVAVFDTYEQCSNYVARFLALRNGTA